MRIFGWAKSFEEQKTCEDILGRVRRTEITYWIYMAIPVFITLGGLTAMSTAAPGDLKHLILGLFWALFGIINICMIKLWAHLRLVKCYMIWDSQNRTQAELDKMKSMDL